MRHFYIGLAALVLTAALCLLGSESLHGRAEQLCDNVCLAKSEREAGRTQAAKEVICRTESDWQAQARLFSALWNHEAVLQISLAFRELANSKGQDFPALCDRLMLELTRRAELERPYWHNIL